MKLKAVVVRIADNLYSVRCKPRGWFESSDSWRDLALSVKGEGSKLRWRSDVETQTPDLVIAKYMRDRAIKQGGLYDSYFGCWLLIEE